MYKARRARWQVATMSDWLHARSRATPENTAIIIGKQSWSYGELNRLVDGVCRRLLDAGVVPGQLVAVLRPNDLLYVCLLHALARLGVVLIPLNTRLTSRELSWQLAHVQCQLLLYSTETAQTVKFLSVEKCRALMVDDQWLTGSDSFTFSASPLALERLHSILFTSGTSGRPKGVMLTFANHFWSAMASAFHLGTQPDDRWLSCLPLYHVGGLAVIFRSCLYGTAVILHDGFDLDAINDSLDTQGATLISLVPTMLYRLLPTRTHWPSSLRLILLGGAAAPPELIHQANALPRQSPTSGIRAPIVAPTYGLTEAASQVATMLPANAADKPGSVGRPLMFTSVRIVGEDGDALPPGAYGEIVVSGPTVMLGYYSKEPPDAEALPPGGFTSAPYGKDAQPLLYTGDIGYLDKEGDLWVVQRRSDLIVSGGENIYPAEVEAVLRQHPAVTAACVVGVTSAEWGQQVAAMVAVQQEGGITADDLIGYCRQHLAGYKIPRLIRLVAALPHTASGKVHRQEVVDLLMKKDQ